jgi:hypothetical protein
VLSKRGASFGCQFDHRSSQFGPNSSAASMIALRGSRPRLRSHHMLRGFSDGQLPLMNRRAECGMSGRSGVARMQPRQRLGDG